MRVATRPILPVTKNGRPATSNGFLHRTLFRTVSFSVFLMTGAALLSGGTITIDFEGQGDGTLVTNQYPGLVFSNTIVLSAGLSLNEDEFPPYSGVNVVLDDGGPISISFSGPVISAGGFFTHSQSIQLDAFDAANNLVASSTSISSNNEAISGDPGTMPNEWLTVEFASGFNNLTITGADIGDSFTLDNFTYETRGVVTPEPSAFFLGILGFGAILVLRFRGFAFNEVCGRVTSHFFVLTSASLLWLVVFIGIPIASAQVPPVGIPGSDPAAVSVGVSTTVNITTRVSAPNIIAGSVNVQSLNAQGQAQAVIGLLHDDGISPDLFAGDGVYSGTIVLSPSQTGSLNIRTSAATKGSPLRLVSAPLAIDVLPSGIPVAPTFSDFSQVTTDPATGNRILANEVLVCFTPTTSVSGIISDASLVGSAIVGRYSGLGNCYQFGLPNGSTGVTVDSAVSILGGRPEVLSASPDILFGLATPTYAPYCEACGTPAFNLLRIDKAQFVTSTNSTVAVVDTGIDQYYKDSNPNVVLGPDLVLPLSTPLGDPDHHGTEVTGVIGATAPTQRIYVIRAALQDPISGMYNATSSTIPQAIKNAVDAGADVINISLAGPAGNISINTAFGMAIEYASDRNVLIIAGAGNGVNDRCGDPPSAYTVPLYPAAFASSFRNMLSVAATIGSAGVDQLWACSTFGPWVNIAAPGVDIQTNGVPASRSIVVSGTSVSAPWVAGTAALIKSVNRTWTPTQIISLLQQTGTSFGQSFKRINPVQQVNVQVTGTGTVTISSGDGLNSPDGVLPNNGSVACTSTIPCAQWFLGTTSVHLTASGPVTWGGDCSSGVGTTLTLTLNQDENCTAVFTTTPPPPNCTTPCTVSFGSYQLLVQYSQIYNNSGTYNSFVDITWCNTGTIVSNGPGSNSYHCQVSPGGIPFSLQPTFSPAAYQLSCSAANQFGSSVSDDSCALLPGVYIFDATGYIASASPTPPVVVSFAPGH